MKKLLSFLLCTALVLALIPGAAATTPKIVDDANLLTTSEEQSLESIAQQLTDKYQMDVVIVTVDSIGFKSAEAYADDYFDYNGYGIGDDYSGMLFLLSMEYRDWAISTCGETIYALTDYGIETLFESIKGYLSNDNYYQAFYYYLLNLEYYFDAYRENRPVDGYHDSDVDDYIIYDPNDSGGIVHYDPHPTAGDIVRMVLISLVIGIIAGAIVLAIMRGDMNTFRAQPNASNYIGSGGFRLSVRKDNFLNSKVSKTLRETPSSSSGGSSFSSRGGGSSFHSSSSGRSHGGRSGKF
jgi:uncharacterized protein